MRRGNILTDHKNAKGKLMSRENRRKGIPGSFNIAIIPVPHLDKTVRFFKVKVILVTAYNV